MNDFDSGERGWFQISEELACLLTRQTAFYKTGVRRKHTPDEILDYEASRERVRELFFELERLRKSVAS